jgi:ABC-2 type transport system permease protein
MSWWHIFTREIKQMFITDRRRAIFLFGASLAYLFLFSLLYGTHTVKAIPLVIYDQDQTQFSRSLIQAFDDSERFQIVSYVTTQDDMENALHEKEAYAALDIPQKFTQDAKSAHSSTVLLLADGSNIIITNTITSAAQEIIAAFSRETGARLTEINNVQLPSMAFNKAGPIDLRLRVLNNPTQSYLSFFVLGLSMAAFQQGIFLAVGASILSEYQNPDELKNAHPLSIMTGKLFPYWISASLAFFITVIAAIYFFEIPGKASMISLFFLSAAFIFAAIGFSAFIASICNNELTFTRISIAYTVPAFVLSGYTWPQEAMDTVGKIISYTFPLSYFSNTFRELMIAGYSPVLYRNIFILFLFGFVFTSIAMLCYIRRTKQIHSVPNC